MPIEKKFLTVGVYVCEKCGNKEKVEQTGLYVKAPKSCAKCGAVGPFRMVREENVFEFRASFGQK